jgi:DNA-binding PadR family transcriptional regulator
MYAVAPTPNIDDNITLQDKVRHYLQNFHERDISITISELSNQLSQPEPSIYQVINNLRKNNEIELEKEATDGNREKIVGIRINRLNFSGRKYVRRTDRSGPVTRIMPDVEDVETDVTSLDNVKEYLEKKLAVEDMKARAIQAGLNESVISFEENPLGEEAIFLLKMWSETKDALEKLQEVHMQLGFDYEAEKRNVTYLKGVKREETDKMLREG